MARLEDLLVDLKDQLVSPGLAQRLKALDVKQVSHFYWEKCDGEWRLDSLKVTKSVCSAFSSTELGFHLPPYVVKDNYCCHLSILREWNKWHYYYASGSGQVVVEAGPWPETLDTEANSRAKLLIHLIEKGLLE